MRYKRWQTDSIQAIWPWKRLCACQARKSYGLQCSPSWDCSTFPGKSAAQNLKIESADITDAYLYWDVYYDIYMQQTTNSTGKQLTPGFLCKLRKSLFGPLQAGEIWGQSSTTNLKNRASVNQIRIHAYISSPIIKCFELDPCARRHGILLQQSLTHRQPQVQASIKTESKTTWRSKANHWPGNVTNDRRYLLEPIILYQTSLVKI